MEDYVTSIILSPYNTTIEYEYDYENKNIIYKNELPNNIRYPFCYSLVLNTLTSNNKSLKNLILLHYDTYPGIIIKTKIIGTLLIEVDKLLFKEYVLSIPYNIKKINNIYDIKNTLLEDIKIFFKKYYENIDMKVKIKNFDDKNRGYELYNSYNKKFIDKKKNNILKKKHYLKKFLIKIFKKNINNKIQNESGDESIELNYNTSSESI